MEYLLRVKDLTFRNSGKIEYKGKVKGKEKRFEFRNEEDERRAVCGSDDDDLGPQV